MESSTVQPGNPTPRYRHANTANKIWRSKEKHRTYIKPMEWCKDGYANTDVLERLSHIDPSSKAIDVLDAREVSKKEFFRTYACAYRPCLIKNGMEAWKAMKDPECWSIDGLEKRLSHQMVNVGKDDDGRKIKIKYKYFADYCRNQEDDSPLYLFQTLNSSDPLTYILEKDYEHPSEFFPADLFNLVGEEDKPPSKWFCIGPKRSGTTVHTDPLGTNAWNAVTSGRKRWVLFEPQAKREEVKGKGLRRKGEDDEAIQYFDFILPRIRQAYPSLPVYECIQEEGDLIFVPGHWWHGVVNLEDTVAITMNYCGYDNFDDCWIRCKKERPVLSQRWLQNMRRFSLKDLEMRSIYLDFLYKKGEIKNTGRTSSSSSSSSSYSSEEEEENINFLGVRNLKKRYKMPWVDVENMEEMKRFPPRVVAPRGGGRRGGGEVKEGERTWRVVGFFAEFFW